MSPKKIIDIRELIASKNPTLLKWLPGFVIRYLERILHQEEINDFMNSCPDAYDEDFCDAVMDYLDIEIKLEGIENLPKEGKLVLAMNHPLGGMDAIALVSGLRKHRTGLKFIVNDLLLHLQKMNGLFLGVNKHGKNTLSKRGQIDELFSSEHVVCIFPAGMVSRKIDGKVRDLEWKKTFITLSRKHDRTIVPIYIDGSLSNFFYRLSNFRKGLGIKANIEMLYLSNELFKLKGSKMCMRVGNPVKANSFDSSISDKECAQLIKDQVYLLEK